MWSCVGGKGGTIFFKDTFFQELDVQFEVQQRQHRTATQFEFPSFSKNTQRRSKVSCTTTNI